MIVWPQVLSCLPLLPQNLARMHEKNTWHVRVNYCPSRQVFIGLTTAPEHAIGTMNIAKVPWAMAVAHPFSPSLSLMRCMSGITCSLCSWERECCLSLRSQSGV